MSRTRYRHHDLLDFSRQLLGRAGLDDDKAGAVADILVEGDLLGHDTHGLALLGPYLAALESGTMTRDGEPDVLADFPAALTWDGRRLPGPWRQLIDYAALVATVRGVPIDPQLRVEPTADQPKLRVRVMGILPTHYLRESILRSLQAHRNVDIATSGLVVDPRYIVRAGDTLEAIAARLYGDRTRWKSVWSSNQAAIPSPGKLAIGTVLTLPP